MLRADFPNIKCRNGHTYPYGEAECQKCHQTAELPKMTTEDFCECGMVRPFVKEIVEGNMSVHNSRFCLWCGKYFEEQPTIQEPAFSY